MTSDVGFILGLVIRRRLPAQEDLGFSNYLMFKPAGGIWVPLRLITWELHDASLNLTVQGGATITGDHDSTAFPDWKNTFKNYGM